MLLHACKWGQPNMVESSSDRYPHGPQLYMQHGDLTCLSRIYYPDHNYPKKLCNGQITAEPPYYIM